MKSWCLLLLAVAVFLAVEARPKLKKSNYISRQEDDSSEEDFVQRITSKRQCGYGSCTEPVKGMLNVHLVPHTHDDVGWLKTVDQYYYGSRSMIQKAGVQYILDSVISELLKDPKKKFIYVETAFLWQWWKEQHDTLRHQVKKLVNEGRLEIIGGAWSMNDEATTHYQSIIDQFTWGFRKLNETFGQCGRPRVGWQIDPFGHSREMASLFAQMGFDGMFFGRLDYQDKLRRLDTKTAEMLWQGSSNLGEAAELFTGVLYNNYGPPPGFCFDVLCQDEPIIDDKRSADYNVDERITQFIEYVKLQRKSYDTDNIILTMGEDFNYQDANMWFKNMDKLIHYVNARQENGSAINVFYSTPSCYLKSLHDTGKSWPVKRDDFFPYASDPHTYWTGYFTSRPTLKYFERVGNNMLQMCKQLYSLARLGAEDWSDLNRLREAMGVMQHHDAITGTEKQKVAQDYARILNEGIEECQETAQTALRKLMIMPMKKSKAKSSHHSHQETIINAPPIKLQLESCSALNVSQCDVSEGSNKLVVTLYNPLAHEVSQYVRLPIVEGSKYSVKDPKGEEIVSQLVPIPEGVMNIPGRFSNASFEVVFRAQNIPPLGFKSFFVTRLQPQAETPISRDSLYTDLSGTDKITLGNKNVTFEVDKNTGLLTSTKWNNFEMPTSQAYFFYRGAVGNNEEFLNRSSGAYIFRPNGTEYEVNKKVEYKVITGPVVDEVHQVFDDWISQVIRVYKDEDHIEFDWVVGPIPINDTLGGKEVVSRFFTNIQSNGTFYTDSNGREMLKRIRNHRPTWDVSIIEQVAGNYYPVTARIRIEDEEPQGGAALSVLNDRAQGGSSLSDGSVELMVHRRLLHDDAFGVGEALNEEAFGTGLVVRGEHYLLGGKVLDGHPTLAARERELAQRKLLKAWTFFSDASELTFEQWQSRFVNEYSGLRHALPSNVHILTLEPWRARSLLIRLEHILEKNDDPVLSQSVNVDLRKLFTPFEIQEIRETTLGGNEWLSDAKRLKFKAGEDITSYKSPRDSDVDQSPPAAPPCNCGDHENDVSDSDNEPFETNKETVKMSGFYEPVVHFNVTLKAMQIRTFIVELKQ